MQFFLVTVYSSCKHILQEFYQFKQIRILLSSNLPRLILCDITRTRYNLQPDFFFCISTDLLQLYLCYPVKSFDAVTFTCPNREHFVHFCFTKVSHCQKTFYLIVILIISTTIPDIYHDSSAKKKKKKKIPIMINGVQFTLKMTNVNI